MYFSLHISNQVSDFGVSHQFATEAARTFRSLSELLKSKSRGNMTNVEGIIIHCSFGPTKEVCNIPKYNLSICNDNHRHVSYRYLYTCIIQLCLLLCYSCITTCLFNSKKHVTKYLSSGTWAFYSPEMCDEKKVS